MRSNKFFLMEYWYINNIKVDVCREISIYPKIPHLKMLKHKFFIFCEDEINYLNLLIIFEVQYLSQNRL